MKVIKPQTSKGPAERFTGDVYPTALLVGEEPSRVGVFRVRFTSGARTAWHTHPVGQYLHILDGTALVQERGDEIKVLKPGDAIYTAPGVGHWHGATPDSFMEHLAIVESAGPDSSEPTATWGEHVTDEEYGKSQVEA